MHVGQSLSKKTLCIYVSLQVTHTGWITQVAKIPTPTTSVCVTRQALPAEKITQCEQLFARLIWATMNLQAKFLEIRVAWRWGRSDCILQTGFLRTFKLWVPFSKVLNPWNSKPWELFLYFKPPQSTWILNRHKVEVEFVAFETANEDI